MATSLFLNVGAAGTSFVTAPFLLDWLGTTRYGAFRAAMGWFGFIGLLDLGVGGALQAVFARALGTGDSLGVVAAARTGARVYFMLAAMMAAAAAGLTFVLPGLIRLPAALTGELRLGCGMYLLTFAYLPLISFRPLAEAEQRGYLVNLLMAGQLFGAAAAGVALAYAGWGFVGQFAALVIGGAVFHFGLAWDGIRRHPEVLDQTKVTTGVGRSLRDLGWPTLLFTLSGRLGLTTDEIIVAGLLGPTAVTSFFLSKQVIAVAGGQIHAVGGATWAGLVDLHFRGERELFVLRFTQLTRLTAIVGAGLLLPVAVWNRSLIGLWVGSDRYAGEAVTWLTAWTAWGQAVVAFWLWPMVATGRVRATLPAILCSTAINLGVSLSATAALGLPGPLIGTAVASAGVTWWWTLLLLKRHFGVQPRLLLGALAAPAMLAVAYGSALVVVARVFPAYGHDWPRWAGLLAVAGWLAAASGGYFVLAWFLALPESDRAEWVGRMRGWLRGGPRGTE
jgi:O-antigen/teichoic acid export membrane protein